MDPRTRRRLLILVAFVIVVAAVGLVLLIGGGTDTADQPETVQQATRSPQETVVPTETATVEPTAQPLTEIVVAVQPIARGVVIPPGAVELRPWPLAAAPFESFADPEEVIGRIARTDIFVEQPVLTNMVVDSLQDLADVGSDAAAILRPGTVAVAVPMDRVTSVAYAIQPGDRVNIMASFLFIDIDEQFQSALPNDVNLLTASEAEGGVALGIGPSVNGRFETRRIPVPLFDGTALQPLSFDWPAIIRPSEAPRPRLLVQQTIQNAQVMWTGDFPRDGILFEPVPSPTPVPATIDPRQQQQQQAEQPTPVPPRPDIVTLAVTPQEAVILTWMVEARIPITFSLRSAADASGLPTTPVTLDYILNEYDITVPARNDYSIQPAIRSIRQLLVGQTISLSN